MELGRMRRWGSFEGGGCFRALNRERPHRIQQRLHLTAQRLRHSRCFFHASSILLSVAVDALDGLVQLGDVVGLRAAGTRDLLHDVRDALH